MKKKLSLAEMQAQALQRREELGLGSADEAKSLVAALSNERPPDGISVKIPVSKIRRSPYQPRLTFPLTELQELAENIRESGELHQPIRVRTVAGGYELIDGERRLQTFEKVLKWPEVDAFVKDYDDTTAAKQVVLSNLSRVDLCDFERARGVRTLLETGVADSNVACARLMSVDEKVIRNLLRYFDLPPNCLRELEAAPRAVTVSFVTDLVEAAREGHEDVVADAIRLAGQGKIKGKGMLTYIAKHSAGEGRGRASRVSRPLQSGAGRVGSLTIGTGTITIKLEKSIDPLRVAEALEKALQGETDLKK